MIESGYGVEFSPSLKTTTLTQLSLLDAGRFENQGIFHIISELLIPRCLLLLCAQCLENGFLVDLSLNKLSLV